MAYSRTRYGTGYYIYHQFVPGTPLSQTIRTWNPSVAPAQDVLDFVNKAGTDLSPAKALEKEGTIAELPAGETVQVVSISGGARCVRKLSFRVPRKDAVAFGRGRLRMTWDEREQPSIDAPIALFFGAGTLYNRDDREYLVKALPSFIRFEQDEVELTFLLPMPFFSSARIELIGPSRQGVTSVKWSVRTEKLEQPSPARVTYFHATYKDHPSPEPGRDLVLLDTRKIEGSEVWSGHFVGNSWIFSDRANLGTLEGDPRFFFDDSQTPQAYGTGTEEWGGGGDYWGGLNMTLPLAGHPVGARSVAVAKSEEDKIESAYRFLIADYMPFGRNARIHLEHGGENLSTEHYQTVTYWYGAPAPSLLKTDTLKIGDLQDEKAHKYSSPDASEPYSFASRFEWGVDTIKVREAGADPKSPPREQEVYPAESDFGRKTTGPSEFTLKIDPRNLGVMLRRKLDYSFPNQRAEIHVKGLHSRWEPAGIWYLAGGNTCIYSNPREELGATQHNVQTSNRRFREDEFLLPLRLTQGRSSIQVRVKFTPVRVPLFPGHPLSELAWSEMRYDAYCFVEPKWNPKAKKF
jgi:hypothetical protein